LGSNLGETIQNLIQNFQGAYTRRFNPNNNSQTPGEVHHGVTCDSCKAYPIIGSRYKCSTCPDYDLCQSCNSQGKYHKKSTKIREISLRLLNLKNPNLINTLSRKTQGTCFEQGRSLSFQTMPLGS
jgi:hypothetical protein